VRADGAVSPFRSGADVLDPQHDPAQRVGQTSPLALEPPRPPRPAVDQLDPSRLPPAHERAVEVFVHLTALGRGRRSSVFP
jgi:hypothetical protein